MLRLRQYIRQYAEHERKMEKIQEQIDREARKLLLELQRINGWECMIKHCRYHYEKYKKDFFGWCQVTTTDDSVQFVKGYSNGDEYNVLSINLYKPLEQQVHERMEEMENEQHRKETNIRKKELSEFERIKKKYGL